jgi:serine/threonine protein kinase
LLSEGQVVSDSYEVERTLGRGGMGEVWLAKHRRLAGKQVAIKVLHLADGPPGLELLARFRREAEIAARLEHPNIVQVLDFDTLPTGEPFLVMELLKGESLASRARGAALPFSEVRAIVRQVGSALAAAHSAGIVHRDLKPDNIFLVPTSLGDQVKVLDFGISKMADSSTLQTVDSVLIGTPRYMSPEQALGKNREVTPQSDLFSLGSICYELLSGRPPFDAETVAQVVFRIAYEPHVPLLTVAPEVPLQAAAAVERLLAKTTAERTRDIGAFVLDFTGAPLAAVVAPSLRESPRGLVSPDLEMSQSLAEGATVTPSIGRPESVVRAQGPKDGSQRLASPVGGGSALSSAPGEPKPPDRLLAPRRRSRTWLWLAPGMLVVSIAGWRGWLGLRAGSRDAQAPLPAASLADASVAALRFARLPDRPAEPPDVHAELASMDSGVPSEAAAVFPEASKPVEAEDAGTVPSVAPLSPSARPPRPGASDPPLTSEERSILAQAEHLRRAGEWDDLYDAASRARLSGLVTRGARRQALELLTEAACHRRDLSAVNAQLNRLEGLSPAAARTAKAKCRLAWPEAGL